MIFITKLQIVPVILAGGKGERFWPLSREAKPKQILPLISSNPMIHDTCKRLDEFEDIFIVANNNLCDLFQNMLPEKVKYIRESVAKNTAAAMALACFSLKKKYGDCIVFFDTADHCYKGKKDYLQIAHKAAEFAEKSNKIILIGKNPTSPNTGFGYIKYGEELEKNFFNIKCFREKPNLETAIGYVESGKYTWNTGIYITKCSVFIEEIKIHMRKLYDGLTIIYEKDFKIDVIKEEFNKLNSISIEYGVTEKTEKIVVLNTTMEWDDVGDFNSIARVNKSKPDGNYYDSDVVSINAEKNIIISDKLVTLIGVHDLIIVETDDALLVCKRSDTQKIKKLVEKLDKKYL